MVTFHILPGDADRAAHLAAEAQQRGVSLDDVCRLYGLDPAWWKRVARTAHVARALERLTDERPLPGNDSVLAPDARGRRA